MARPVVLLLLLATAGILFMDPAVAGTKHMTFKYVPRRRILFDRFSSGRHGWVSISITGAKASSRLGSPDQSLLGFFLLSDEALFQAISFDPSLPKDLYPNPEGPSCILSSPYIIPLFTFADLDDESHYNKTFPITHADEYNLFFASCAPETMVTMDVRTNMYNANRAAQRFQGLLPLRRRGLHPHELL
ncbi:unnamed protein product [Urochloa humidicola]